MQEFFGQLDQRVLNAFLKACDELTDILPEQEQQTLQETVRKLHKQWKVSLQHASSLCYHPEPHPLLSNAVFRVCFEHKVHYISMWCVVVCVSQDLQTEVPYHLLQLKVEVERGRLMGSLQECQAELARENRSLPAVGSERLIREHRVRLAQVCYWPGSLG